MPGGRLEPPTRGFSMDLELNEDFEVPFATPIPYDKGQFEIVKARNYHFYTWRTIPSSEEDQVIEGGLSITKGDAYFSAIKKLNDGKDSLGLFKHDPYFR